MFIPINLPPTEHHTFSTGHSTENGDNAKTVGEKVNAGFKHVYDVLRGLGATLADEVEYVAKSEFDALVHELDEVKAEFANLKMMVQGLGFAGVKANVSALDTMVVGSHVNTDGSHSMALTAPADIPSTHGMTGMSWGGLTGEPVATVIDPSHQILAAATGGEPVVTVKEVTEQ